MVIAIKPKEGLAIDAHKRISEIENRNAKTKPHAAGVPKETTTQRADK